MKNLISEKSSPPASSVPVAVITVSPNKKTKDSEQETTRQEAAELKQKLEEVTRLKEDYKKRLAEVSKREKELEEKGDTNEVHKFT